MLSIYCSFCTNYSAARQLIWVPYKNIQTVNSANCLEHNRDLCVKRSSCETAACSMTVSLLQDLAVPSIHPSPRTAQATPGRIVHTIMISQFFIGFNVPVSDNSDTSTNEVGLLQAHWKQTVSGETICAIMNYVQGFCFYNHGNNGTLVGGRALFTTT